MAESEFDFPPPPSDLELNSGHAKQLSEASLLSEASTVKQRKSPSLDDCDDITVVTSSVQNTDHFERWSHLDSRTNNCEQQLRDLSVAGMWIVQFTDITN